jgi:hypothetical protein
MVSTRSSLFSSVRIGLLVLPCFSLSLACGGGDPSSADAGTGERQEACPAGFLPLKVGAKWSYRVKDSSGTFSTKETTVEAPEQVSMVPGVTAFKVITRKGTSMADETVSWQQIDGTKVVRYQEQSYGTPAGGAAVPTVLEWWSPYKLRVDWSPEHLQKGVTWMLTYSESSNDRGAMSTHPRNELWKVEGVNESVTVPAGTYKTLRVSRMGTDQMAMSNKSYWFACGLGKVKETGGQVEELMGATGL